MGRRALFATAREFVPVFTQRKILERVRDLVQDGEGAERAREIALSEFRDDPERLQRELEEEHPEVVRAFQEEDAALEIGGHTLRTEAQRWGIDAHDARSAEAVRSDPLADRAVDAVLDGDQHSARRLMAHLAARLDPEAFYDRASEAEVEDAIQHGGVVEGGDDFVEQERALAEMSDEQIERQLAEHQVDFASRRGYPVPGDAGSGFMRRY